MTEPPTCSMLAKLDIELLFHNRQIELPHHRMLASLGHAGIGTEWPDQTPTATAA